MITPGATGTSGSTLNAGYRLAGGETDTLKGLQNQRVEIRGMIELPKAAADSTAPPMKTLRITSIRPVAGDCGAVQ